MKRFRNKVLLDDEGVAMKKIVFSVVSIMVIAMFLIGSLSITGCSKEKKEFTFKALLTKYLAKDVSISMWNSEKRKPIQETFILAEANDDYIVLKQQGEKEKAIAVPFSNITNVIMSETPPVIVLNDQIMLSGFGDTADGLGYVGSRIERLRTSTTKSDKTTQ